MKSPLRWSRCFIFTRLLARGWQPGFRLSPRPIFSNAIVRHGDAMNDASLTTRKEGGMILTPIERARAYVDKIPSAVAGQEGHNQTFAAACALTHGFALDESDALTVLREYSTRCLPPWNEIELAHKINSAAKASHNKPRGHLIGSSFNGQHQSTFHHFPTQADAKSAPRASQVDYDEAKLRALAAKMPGVDEEWLWERSPVRPECMTPGAFLLRLYRPGERIQILTAKDAWRPDFTFTVTEPPCDTGVLKYFMNGFRDVFYLLNPVDGSWHTRQGARPSCRSQESVTVFRYALLESDTAPEELWLSALAQFPIPIAAIYRSGGRSIHALWQVNATIKAEWDARVIPLKAAFKVLGADENALTAVRTSRLPQCEQLTKGGVSKLLYFNPTPPETPLADMPIRETRASMLERLKGCEMAEDSNDLDYISPTALNAHF